MGVRHLKTLHDTLHILEQGHYEKDGKTVPLKLSKSRMEAARVLLPADVQDICGRRDVEKTTEAGARCAYSCVNMDSFAAARRQYPYASPAGAKPVLVLNFANSTRPGGGVRIGATAQEEDLCRKSSLLLSLESKDAAAYYKYHRRRVTSMGMASDAMIFTPEVEIIRDETGALLEDTVIVAVLTCAAPMITFGRGLLSKSAYESMVYNRIMGMLKCSACFGYDRLVLGAWGCGAFGNDARVISGMFRRALTDLEFNGLRESDFFRRIDFAVLDRTAGQYNYRQFAQDFDNFCPALTGVK